MKTARTFRFVRRILILATVLPLPAQEMNDALRSVTITPGVELHYIEKGKGVPVIFIHGTLGDYSVWQPQLRFFAGSYRALAYSRRYNYPNTNPQQPNPGTGALPHARRTPDRV